jgi:hypothetical protein
MVTQQTMEISSYSSRARWCRAVPAHASLYTRWLTKDECRQRIKAVLFFTETRCVVGTQRRFRFLYHKLELLYALSFSVPLSGFVNEPYALHLHLEFYSNELVASKGMLLF